MLGDLLTFLEIIFLQNLSIGMATNLFKFARQILTYLNPWFYHGNTDELSNSYSETDSIYHEMIFVVVFCISNIFLFSHLLLSYRWPLILSWSNIVYSPRTFCQLWSLDLTGPARLSYLQEICSRWLWKHWDKNI